MLNEPVSDNLYKAGRYFLVLLRFFLLFYFVSALDVQKIKISLEGRITDQEPDRSGTILASLLG